MRAVLIVSVATLLAVGCNTVQRRENSRTAPASGQPVVAGCATCIFEMEGVSGCVLAVKIAGKHYLVNGSDIDDHGDAHEPRGLCNSARDALVEGTIEGDRFVAGRFELKPYDAERQEP